MHEVVLPFLIFLLDHASQYHHLTAGPGLCVVWRRTEPDFNDLVLQVGQAT